MGGPARPGLLSEAAGAVMIQEDTPRLHRRGQRSKETPAKLEASAGGVFCYVASECSTLLSSPPWSAALTLSWRQCHSGKKAQ